MSDSHDVEVPRAEVASGGTFSGDLDTIQGVRHVEGFWPLSAPVLVRSEVWGSDCPVTLGDRVGLLIVPAREECSRGMLPPPFLRVGFGDTYWGSVWDDDSEQQFGSADIERLGLSFPVASGSQALSAHASIVAALPDWWDVLRRWLEVATHQDLGPPELGVSSYAGGTLWLSTPEVAIRRHNVATVPGSIRTNAVGASVWAVVVGLANMGTVPHDAHDLLSQARAAAGRGRRRQAVIDAGSAVEQAIRHAARCSGTLGHLNNDKAEGLGLSRDELDTKLVQPRNAAMHEVRVPSEAQVHEAQRIAAETVRHLAPLPVELRRALAADGAALPGAAGKTVE